MQPHDLPACPRCASTERTTLRVTPQYRLGLSFATPRGERPVATTYVYQCRCGLTFTHTARLDQSGEQCPAHFGRDLSLADYDADPLIDDSRRQGIGLLAMPAIVFSDGAQ